ncbi:Ig-like domain-containing protein [Bradyrhizobium ottawaense]
MRCRHNSGNEDTTITGTVASNDSDVDDGATLSYSLNAPVAGLTLNADGSYSFDAGYAAYQHLAEGATTAVVANYHGGHRRARARRRPRR